VVNIRPTAAASRFRFDTDFQDGIWMVHLFDLLTVSAEISGIGGPVVVVGWNRGCDVFRNHPYY
jgi:hypothetical protein